MTHEYVDVEGTEDLDGAWFIDHAGGSNRADEHARDIHMLLDGLAAAPDVAWVGPRRHCLHRWAWFDGQTLLSKLSEPYEMASEDIAFVAGPALHPDRRPLVVSYGVADGQAWRATVPAAEVRRLLGV